jgi:Tfp pilus assembly protein PilX
MRSLDHRQRGATALIVVLASSLLIGTFVMSSGALLTPTLKGLRQSHNSDRALAIAEAGVALARAELAHDPSWSGCEALTFADATLTVVIDRREDAVLVLSRGTLTHKRLPQPGVTRRVTARLRLDSSRRLPVVVAWKDR